MGVINILEREFLNIVAWFETNKMIVNPDKFQALIIEKRQDHTNIHISIDTQNVKAAPSVKLLGVEIDGKLNFNLHMLSAMTRLKKYLRFGARKLLISSYFTSNFNYCQSTPIFA